jgi:hypothetical protein
VFSVDLRAIIIISFCFSGLSCNNAEQFKGKQLASRESHASSDSQTSDATAKMPSSSDNNQEQSDEGADGGASTQPLPEGVAKEIAAGNADGASGGSSAADAVEGADGAIAVRGKSLDLYAVFDVSQSLTRTDSQCLRFEAFKEFRAGLKEKLGAEGDVRITLITFSEDPRLIGTLEKALQLSDQDFDQQYRGEICRTYANTIPLLKTYPNLLA